MASTGLLEPEGAPLVRGELRENELLLRLLLLEFRLPFFAYGALVFL